MVRVISEKLFSPPRSRHSSGETVDKELAARAVEVLSSLNSRRLELSDCESSSDSHWDSEVDVEGDGSEISAFKDQAGGDGKHGGTSDVLRKRKERRRERNKLSAQAYRVRRKEQTVKQQTVLKTLQEHNARLKTSVQNLEDELQKVRHSLRQRGYLALPSPSPTPSSKSCTDTAPGSPSTSSPAADGEKYASFSQLCEQATMTSERCGQVAGMDNDQSRQQQIAPVVDNFLFSKALATPTSSGALNAPTPTPTFTFPSSPIIGARHNFGATPFMATALPTISEKPDDHFGHYQHHPYPKSQLQQQQQQQHSDLNANANTFALANANTINANANVFGMYNNSNRMNNNNNLYQTVPVSREAGACGDRVAQRAPFKVC